MKGLRLMVTPSPARVDDPPSIVVSGRRPGQTVTLRALMGDGRARQWASQAVFEAGGGGTVDVARQRPVTGTYTDADARGLLWSMRLVDGQTAGLLTSAAPLETEFVAESDGMPPTTVAVTRYFAAPDVSQTAVGDQPIGIMGGSRGGDLALLLGATFPEFKAVVGNVPSGIVHAGISGGGLEETYRRPAWTYRG